MRYILRLLPVVRPYLPQLVFNALLLLTATALQLVSPKVIQNVIDIGLLGDDRAYLLRAALILFGLGAGAATLNLFQRYLSEWVAAHIGYDLRNRLYDHIQHLPFSYQDHAETGQLISRSIEDVRSIERFAGANLIELSRILVLLVSILIIMFDTNTRLAALAVLPLIPLFALTIHFGDRVSELFFRVDRALGALSARLQENVTGVQVVRAFAREPEEIHHFRSLNRELFNARLTVIGEWSRVMPATHFLIALGTILILWFGGRMAMRGEMTVGEVVAFNSYLVMLAMPARQLTWLVNSAGEASAGARRVFEVLDVEPEIQSPPNAIVLPTLRGEVTFEHVWLRYQDERRHALRDIHIHIRPNQVVALIGQTGSGKTSLVHLIPRFYDVTRGAVRVDGHDVRSVDLVSLRRQIGIVLQTSLLFSDTVRANIAYGRPEASLDEVVAAAKAAQAHDFIMALPQGYETVIGERGITLSGGQRQRVAIARALLMDPRILILDDSTSSVDAETERLIQIALERLMEGRTTFVIAHRLSTVRRADLILVMEDGRIVQRGTHEELLAQEGLYRQIYNLQLRREEGVLEAV
ncbi:MAG: ABC transporter ATP-binding protein [Anaerolineae bacterium]|nr:MAG: ABC transporter ATP-binding protein [Anaerolineae bacterium]